MKVYVVTEDFDNGESYEDHYHDTENLGVFTTKEGALSYIKSIDVLKSIIGLSPCEITLDEETDTGYRTVVVTKNSCWFFEEFTYDFNIEEFTLDEVKGS